MNKQVILAVLLAFGIASPVWAANRTSNFGMVGIAAGQTVRINVVNTIGDPDILPTPVVLTFFDNEGRIIIEEASISLRPGQSAFLDFNANTRELLQGERFQLRTRVRKTDNPETRINEASGIRSTMEIFDSETGKSSIFIGDPDI